MHTIIHPTPDSRSKNAGPVAAFRTPPYDCEDKGAHLKLVVYLPGVAASGVNVEARGPDLIVTGRKARFVRVNWQPLHLERSQRDYRLNLRLGRGFDYGSMRAEMNRGVLAVTLPKRARDAAGVSTLREVA
ncbi:MAG: Hsp20/alpha crystallin family protein [Opitutaceae bacterium]